MTTKPDLGVRPSMLLLDEEQEDVGRRDVLPLLQLGSQIVSRGIPEQTHISE